MNTVEHSLAAPIVVGLDGWGDRSPPPGATLDGGITSSNGGGQRATGDLENVTVGSNGARVTQQPRDPGVPAY